MQEGATLVADFGDTAMSLVIEGRSVDEARRWTVEATATRRCEPRRRYRSAVSAPRRARLTASQQ